MAPRSYDQRERLVADDFGFLDLDHGLDDWPYLGLGFEHSDPSFFPNPPLTTERRWLRVEHRTRGACDGARFFTVTLLQPTEPAAAAMRELARRWHGSGLGCFGLGPTLDEVLTYRHHLQELIGEDCRYSFHQLEEALYPIDVGPQTIARLSTERLHGDIATLADGLSQPFWCLYVLALNS